MRGEGGWAGGKRESKQASQRARVFGLALAGLVVLVLEDKRDEKTKNEQKEEKRKERKEEVNSLLSFSIPLSLYPFLLPFSLLLSLVFLIVSCLILPACLLALQLTRGNRE